MRIDVKGKAQQKDTRTPIKENRSRAAAAILLSGSLSFRLKGTEVSAWKSVIV
jgi:hypothetical protein